MIASIRVGIVGSSVPAGAKWSSQDSREWHEAVGGLQPAEDSRAPGGRGDDGQPRDQQNQSAAPENKAPSGLEHASLRSYTR